MWDCFLCHFSHAIVILISKKLNLNKLHESSLSEHVESRLRHYSTVCESHGLHYLPFVTLK